MEFVLFWPRLQIICCYIARYFVKKYNVRLGVKDHKAGVGSKQNRSQY